VNPDHKLAGLSPKVVCEQLKWMASRVREMEQIAREKGWFSEGALDKLTVISIALDKTHDEAQRGIRR
jgi:hypothetical protein